MRIRGWGPGGLCPLHDASPHGSRPEIWVPLGNHATAISPEFSQGREVSAVKGEDIYRKHLRYQLECRKWGFKRWGFKQI